MRLPSLVAGVLLSQGCLVPVFIPDGSDATSAAAGASSGGTVAMSEGTAQASTSTASGASATGPPPETVTIGTLYDVGAGDEGLVCSIEPEPCDADSEDFGHALGLNCPGGVQTLGPVEFHGDPASRVVTADVLGTTAVYQPVEGSRRVLLSTGIADHVLLPIADLEAKAGCPKTQTCPSTDLKDGDLASLPAPLDPTPQSCKKGKDLPGTGDCSGTVLEQWQLGGEPLVAYDYTELRFAAVVPNSTAALRFQFAFLTAEYPKRLLGGHNDLFVGWIASEAYTGNLALDPDGNPIGAETLPYSIKLDPMPVDCEPDCPDLPLRGFGFEGHAGTPWWAAEVGVEAGETVELVFALFDVHDGEVDSAVLLDGVRWVCSPPTTGG